jgi:hypothetical protein
MIEAVWLDSLDSVIAGFAVGGNGMAAWFNRKAKSSPTSVVTSIQTGFPQLFISKHKIRKT